MNQAHPELLRIPEVAQILRRTPDTVHRWIRDGAIPSVRVGNTKMIKRADLDALLATRAGAEAALEAHKSDGSPVLSPQQLDIVRRAINDALCALAVGRKETPDA